MGPLRRLLFPLGYAGVRLADRLERVALAGLGIAAGALVVAGVLAGSLVTQDRSLTRTLAEVPPQDRVVRVGYFGVPPQDGGYASLDRIARSALASLLPGQPTRVVQLRQTRIAGALVDLGAIDDLPRWVRLRSGRFPRPCTPERCEVLQIAGEGRIPSVEGVRLVRVGTGALVSPVPFGQLAPRGVSPASLALGTSGPPTQPPFLLAEGVEALSGLPALSSIYRGHSWVLPLTPTRIHPWEVDDFLARVNRVRSTIEVRNYLFDVTAPDDSLQAARDTSRVAGRRLLLIGGQAAALLLAFAVLAAAAMRRDVGAAWQRLTWLGASRSQHVGLVAGEAAALALAGTLVGWGAGTAVAALIAAQAGSPVGAILRHSALSLGGLGAALLLFAAAATVLAVALRARPVSLGGLQLTVADVAALGAAAALAVALTRGSADPSTLAEERGTGVFLLLLPGLVAVVAAIAAARALAPSLRLLQRLGRSAPVSFRLAALSLARNPGHASVAVVFLVVSLGLALFAAVYYSTLVRGQSEQAAFAVPLDFTVREDLSPSGLVKPLELAPLARYRDLGPDTDALPVVRLRASVSRLAGSENLTLLGAPADGLHLLRRWRSDFSAVPLAELARRLRPPVQAALRGEPLSPAARTLVLPVSVHGDDVALSAAVETSRGTFVTLDFGQTAGPKTGALRASLPPRARGGLLVALTLNLLPRSIESGETAEGTLVIGPLAARGPGGTTEVSSFPEWIGAGGIKPRREGDRTRLHYLVSDQLDARFRARQASDGRLVPVIASPRLAAAAGPGGTLAVQLGGPRVSVRVVATARRFPSVEEGEFVVADEQFLATALNASAPGTGVVNELWLGVKTASERDRVGAKLGEPPFDRLDVRSRAALESDLRGDPLARGVLFALAAAAIAALALAVIGLLLALASDLRDERGELFDLEAQGADPPTLRRHLRLRALLVVAFGLLGGLATGAALTGLVVDLVVLTANVSAPQPPLLLTIDWRAIVIAVAGYLVASSALVVLWTWSAFRSPAPSRAPGAAA
jgi:hypothetical protein